MTIILSEARTTTAGDLVTSALKKARVLGQDQTASPGDMSDGLAALNAMLDSWWLERLAVYRQRQESFTWSGASNTIGSGGDFSTTRPVKVTGAFFRVGSTDHPLTIITREQYDSEPLKSTSGTPAYLFYDPEYPLGKLYLFPVPAEGELFLSSYQQIEAFTSPTDEADLPPGYERAVIFNLAVEIAPEYGLEAPGSVQRIAAQSKSILKRHNATPSVLSMPSGLTRSIYDIRRGY